MMVFRFTSSREFLENSAKFEGLRDYLAITETRFIVDIHGLIECKIILDIPDKIKNAGVDCYERHGFCVERFREKTKNGRFYEYRLWDDMQYSRLLVEEWYTGVYLVDYLYSKEV